MQIKHHVTEQPMSQSRIKKNTFETNENGNTICPNLWKTVK